MSDEIDLKIEKEVQELEEMAKKLRAGGRKGGGGASTASLQLAERLGNLRMSLQKVTLQ